MMSEFVGIRKFFLNFWFDLRAIMIGQNENSYIQAHKWYECLLIIISTLTQNVVPWMEMIVLKVFVEKTNVWENYPNGTR